MQDNSSRRQFSQKEKRGDPPDSGTRRKGKSFAAFLIESDLKPLVFIGRCMDYFGLGAVLGVFLGAAGIYGYALFKPLPYAAQLVSEKSVQPTPSPTVQIKTVPLRGSTRDNEGKPITGFWVAVLVYQQGPVYDSQGSFILNVPQSNSYDVALWDSERFGVFTNLLPERDGDGYRLPWALPLSSIRIPATGGARSRIDFNLREQLAQTKLNGQIETEARKR